MEDKCWICGNKADSGEHIIKKSILENSFSNISQKKPIFWRINGKVQKNIIGSLKSKKFHFEKKICSKCNNELTQPYDNAFDKLLNYLSCNKGNNKIDLSKIFGKDYEKQMLYVKLYLAKIFMTKLLSSNIKYIDLPVREFAEGILNGKDIEDFFIDFKYNNYPTNYIVSSDFEVKFIKDTDIPLSIKQFITIDSITIEMIYYYRF